MRAPGPSATDPRARKAGVHGRSDLAAFQSGETRLVYARHRDRPDGPLFHLADGTASRLRSFTRDHLECFLPDCTDRRLTTVSRARARDGFAHMRGAGHHRPESLFHHQGKALIARWARANLPDVAVDVEHATCDRARRADVMLTWPDGARVAVEIQYSPLTVAQWRLRHESYLAAGIRPLWLFGHTAAQLRVTTRAGVHAVRPTAVQRELLAVGASPLWLNPVTEQVATTWADSRPAATAWPTTLPPAPPSWSALAPAEHRAPDPTLLWQWVGAAAVHVVADPDDPPGCQVPAHLGGAPFGVVVDYLRDCTATPAGLVTPSARLLTRNVEDLAAGRAEVAARRATAARTWAHSDMRRKVHARFGVIPPVFSYTTPADLGLRAAPEHWRALLYGDLILAGPVGSTRTVANCIAMLERRGVVVAHRRLAEAAVTGYLGLLADAGCLALSWSTVTVVADLETVAARRRDDARSIAERAASLDRMRDHRARRLQRQTDRRVSGPTPETPTPAPAPPDPSNDARMLRCDGCGNRLAIEQRDAGRHPFC